MEFAYAVRRISSRSKTVACTCHWVPDMFTRVIIAKGVITDAKVASHPVSRKIGCYNLPAYYSCGAVVINNIVMYCLLPGGQHSGYRISLPVHVLPRNLNTTKGSNLAVKKQEKKLSYHLRPVESFMKPSQNHYFSMVTCFVINPFSFLHLIV